MFPLSTVQPITQRFVQVHTIVEKIAVVNGPHINVETEPRIGDREN